MIPYKKYLSVLQRILLHILHLFRNGPSSPFSVKVINLHH